MKHPVKTIVWALIGVVLVFAFVRFVLAGPKIVPQEFVDARAKSVGLAEEIVFLANKSLASLETISKYDAEHNVNEALIAVSKELILSKDVSQRAVALSNELAKMAQQIPNIRPADARDTAAEAITYEVNLVSRLIAYNDSLRELFEFLRSKFTGKLPADTDGKVRELIAKINASANAINDLNVTFNETLKKFDAFYK